MKIRPTLRATIAAEILADIDADGPATLEIYSGTMPSEMGGAIADVKLVTVALPSPFGVQSNGVITMSAISVTPEGLTTGDAGWGRIINGDDVEVLYGTCSIPGAGGTFALNTLQIVEGGPVDVRSGVIAVGGA
jgi:hypothetical protein